MPFTDLTIIPLAPERLPEVLAIYDSARLFMRASGNMEQWAGGYPSAQVIQNDIAAGHAFACMAGDALAAVFAYIPGPDPTYAAIAGSGWLDDAPYHVVHRIAVGVHGKGVGAYCLNWAFAQCGNLRIDTHEMNSPMRRTLEKLGFIYCGVIRLADGSARVAYQKVLRQG